ncbi:MAG: hypothetical protein K1X88_19510 [Nannocystaceae bacterium]|nr:hypothetical protein [Nannocystaceae bacterium]
MSCRRNLLAAVALAPCLALLAACDGQGGARPPGGGGGDAPSQTQAHPWIGKTLFVLTNLHPDTSKKLLYSINYQQTGLIPICTQVQIVALDSEHLRFVAHGIEYRYAFRNEFMTEGVQTHLARYFGESCDAGSSLGAADREGIAAGRVAAGMTKNGVIKAIGYPPPHATPDLASPQWRYWKNRFDTFIVHFEGDTVTSIEN